MISVSFKKPLLKKIKDLYFVPYEEDIYYDKNHMNYIYEEVIDNIKFIFYGFFKDGYFIIILNSFDKNLDVTIENKNVIIIKLDWTLKRINDEKSIWIIDESKLINLKMDALLLPYRNNFFKFNMIDVSDYIKVIDYEVEKVVINIVENKKKINLKDRFLSMIEL
jgi:hypothetical protein